MQYIDHLPGMAQLSLPEAVSQDLYRQRLEPFDSEGDAKQFWAETYCTLIILNPTDSNGDLKQTDTWNDIDFALTYQEYAVPLSNDCQLLVAIVNDSGAGIYLVIPPELSHLNPET